MLDIGVFITAVAVWDTFPMDGCQLAYICMAFLGVVGGYTATTICIMASCTNSGASTMVQSGLTFVNTLNVSCTLCVPMWCSCSIYVHVCILHWRVS